MHWWNKELSHLFIRDLVVLISSSNGITSVRVEHQTLAVFRVFSAHTFTHACAKEKKQKQQQLENHLFDSGRKQQNSEVV